MLGKGLIHLSVSIASVLTLSSSSFFDFLKFDSTIDPPSSRKTPPFVLPERIDWSSYSGSIRDQGSCGACVGFAISAVVETQYVIDCKAPIKRLSPQAILNCGGGNCKTGMSVGAAVSFVAEHGIPSEDCAPYTVTSGRCDLNRCPAVVRPQPIQVTDGTLDVKEIKHALLSGPLLVVMASYPDMKNHSVGVFSPTTGKRDPANHAVMMVGYDDSDGTWELQNFWGSDWGEAGYFRVKQSDKLLGVGDVAWRFKVTCQPLLKTSMH